MKTMKTKKKKKKMGKIHSVLSWYRLLKPDIKLIYSVSLISKRSSG